MNLTKSISASICLSYILVSAFAFSLSAAADDEQALPFCKKKLESSVHISEHADENRCCKKFYGENYCAGGCESAPGPSWICDCYEGCGS